MSWVGYCWALCGVSTRARMRTGHPALVVALLLPLDGEYLVCDMPPARTRYLPCALCGDPIRKKKELIPEDGTDQHARVLPPNAAMEAQAKGAPPDAQYLHAGTGERCFKAVRDECNQCINPVGRTRSSGNAYTPSLATPRTAPSARRDPCLQV